MSTFQNTKWGNVCILICFLLSYSYCKAQVHPDTLLKRAYDIQYIYPDSALSILDSIEIKETAILTDQQLCELYRTKGNVYWFMSKMHTSIRYYRKSLQIGIKNNDKKEISRCQGEIGYVFSDLGQNDSAIFYLRSAINLAEEIKDSATINVSLDYLAHSYDNNGEYKKAIEVYKSILPFFLKNANKRNLHVILTNLGDSYYKMEYLDTAKFYYEWVLSEADSTNESDLIGASKLNLAKVYNDLGDFRKGLALLYQSRATFERIGSVKGLVSTRVGEADLYFDRKQFRQSAELYELAFTACEDAGDLKLQISTMEKLALSYEGLHDFRKAYESLTKLRALEDSLDGYLDEQFLQDMNAKYQSEQKEKQIALLSKDRELKNAKLGQQDAEIERANLQRLLFGIGLTVVLVLALLILLGLRQKHRANKILTDQKTQIEEKNKEIVDSITYAKRIQTAILPPAKLVKKLLPECFVLYVPKDIVAGDFYWLETVTSPSDSIATGASETVLLAACDCTGHGVPGAMVSVICNNGLNRSVREFGLKDPGQILDKTRALVIAEFEKSEDEVKDGMDIALVSITPVTSSVSTNLSNNVLLKYAGANNPLWIIRKGSGEVEEIKADKQPIGKYAQEHAFTTHKIQMQKGDTFYIFTDGFADQFGGDKGKKFKTANFKQLLVSIQDKSITDQQAIIHQELINWQGSYEQVDDVCVIGVRI